MTERGFASWWFDTLSLRGRRVVAAGAAGAAALGAAGLTYLATNGGNSAPRSAECSVSVPVDGTAWGVAQRVGGNDWDPRLVLQSMRDTRGNPADLANVQPGEQLNLQGNLCEEAYKHGVSTESANP
jgi:hypothetical protein